MKGSSQSGDPMSPMSAVWPASIASGALVAQHVGAKATRDTLFLSHFGLALLPAAMIGAALLSAIAVIGISSTLRKYGPARIVPVLFASSAILFLLELWLSITSAQGAAIAVYVHTAIFGTAIVSAFWSLVNERFDPHVAKKVVGRIASGGTVGGVVGGVVVWRASSHLSVPMMLAVLAGINFVGCWGALATVGKHGRGGGTLPEPEAITGGGLKILRETPYLQNLAGLVLAGSVIQALLDWLLSAHASGVYGKGPELLGFFALFNMVVGILSFLAQTGLSRPLLERRGLTDTVKSLPVTVALCAVVALFSPHLWAIVLLRGGEAVTRNSLYRSAYELFYTPLPTAKKRATKTLIDVVFDRVGTTLGSIALLGIVQLGDLATRVVLASALGMAVAAWYVADRLHHGYVSALASSLKSRAVALGDDEPADFITKKTLAETTALLDREKLLARIEQFQKSKEGKDARSTTGGVANATLSPKVAPADVGSAPAVDVSADPVIARAAVLRSGDVARIKAALNAPLTASLASFVIPLLSNDAVVRDAVRALRKIAPKATGQLLDALVDPEVDPHVRRRIPRVLKVCRTQRAASGLMMALKDPVFDVRVQVGLALAQMQDEAHVTLARDEVFDLALHEITIGRASWRQPSAEEVSVLAPLPEAPREDIAVTPSGSSGGSGGGPYRESDPPGATSGVDSGKGATEASDELHRGLAHVFTILGLVLEREPLSIAYRAMRSEDPGLRGTAYEYLEVVLPARVRDVLVPLLGDVKPTARTQERGSKELADVLLRSSASRDRARGARGAR